MAKFQRPFAPLLTATAATLRRSLACKEEKEEKGKGGKEKAKEVEKETPVDGVVVIMVGCSVFGVFVPALPWRN